MKVAPISRFLAVHTMTPEDLASLRKLPNAEQDALDAVGIAERGAQEERNAAFFLDRGGMLGKTTRLTRNDIAEAGKSILRRPGGREGNRPHDCSEPHPHITVYPGDGVDIMPSYNVTSFRRSQGYDDGLRPSR